MQVLRPLDASAVKWSGFVVAAVGFLLSRTTVALAVYETPLQFLTAGVVPLVGGLLLSVFGVALAVSDLETAYVRRVTVWCLGGVVAMLSLVVLTALGRVEDVDYLVDAVAQTRAASFLVAGAIGGALLGVRTADRNRQREALRRQTSRLVTLNRILRHEVLNAAAVILGHVDHAREEGVDSLSEEELRVLRERGEHIRNTIDDVKFFTQSNAGDGVEAVSLGPCLTDSVERLREAHPDATVEVGTVSEADVMANTMLGAVFDNLLENAAEHAGPAADVRVDATVNEASVVVAVRDDGPGLPAGQRAILEGNDIAEYDDPTTGFGLNVVRLLIEQYGGDVRVPETDGGTTVEVELLRTSAAEQTLADEEDVYGLSPSLLFRAIGAALFAGSAMGLLLQFGADTMPIIGALYGVDDLTVGWITHLFHSVVFGIIYASIWLRVRGRYVDDGYVGAVAVALVQALFLWAVAAGLVMPVWLLLLNIPADLPSLTLPSLAGHLVWGTVLGVTVQYLCD